MAFPAKNQTNPSVIDATGYAPYVKLRAERADASGCGGLKENRRAQTIRDYWNRKHFVDELREYTRKHDADLFRNQWECEADRKALYSRVRWEMDKITAEMERELEERRDRLTSLLKSEEADYLEQMGAVQEDPVEKQERMLQRYAVLKAGKEMEREKIVEEKREQQFKRNCEELRTLVSQKIQKETAEEGRKVVKEKEQEMIERSLEDKMYAELWARDREAKELKDAQEAQEKRRKGVENGRFVQDQILKNRLDRQKIQREKEHDLAIMEERMRLTELEDHYDKELKKRKQVELKSGLDQCTREKLKRRTKEVQDDLMQDLFFMRKIADSEEEAAKCEKKRALMQEQKHYLKYLEDRIKAEAQFEKEVDQMYLKELEDTWKRREEEWERERRRRRQLEQEVLNEVQEQIRSNLDKAQKIQSLNMLYSQKVLDEDAGDKRRASEKLKLIRERNEAHQKELLDQMKRKEDELKEQKTKRDIELELLKKEREEQEKRIEKLLTEIKIDNEHPYRSRARELC